MQIMTGGGKGPKMTATRPYIVRAIYQWIIDNDLTPYLLVRDTERNQLPKAFLQDGQIVLNISPSAVRDLIIADNLLSFKARFDGVVEHIFVSMQTVLAIYAKESGRGIAFDENEQFDDESACLDTDEDDPPPRGGGRGHLRIIK